MRRLARGSLTGIALCLAAAAVANGDTPRAKVDAVFTSDVPGSSTGRLEYGDFSDPANPGGKPHGVSRVVLTLADGARWDTGAIAQCTASDAELMASGAGACPADSKVGQGPVVVDTGIDGPNRDLHFDFTAFNAKDALILVGREQGTGGTIVVHGKIDGGTLDITFPPAPGTPPDGGALKTERIVFFERHGYLTTPPACPASGAWVNRLTYTYADGVSETVASASPCSAPAPAAARDTAAPRVVVTGVPHRRCVGRSFVLRVRTTDASPVSEISAFLDGRRFVRVPRGAMRKRVVVRRGRHRLRVTATDSAGNTRVRHLRLRRC